MRLSKAETIEEIIKTNTYLGCELDQKSLTRTNVNNLYLLLDMLKSANEVSG